MLFTVSTVKETVDGLDRFVRRNLAGGVDHLLVFVEDPTPDVMAWLDARGEVTAVATDTDWWGGRQPPQLNARQKINANLARTVLACEPEAEWVFHLDGDEVLNADRAALGSLPDEATVVHAPPLEAVSRESWPDGRATWFKRLLGEDDLTLLRVLGVLDRSANEDYFHGHVKGKSGMRPGMDRWFTLHEVTDATETDVAAYDAGDSPVATLLHYESWSGEEFVRKWTNILASGQLPAMRGNRQAVAVALRALGARGLPPETQRDFVARLYRLTTQDDLETLRGLGLLVELDPDAGAHRPRPLPDRSRHQLESLLAAFRGVDKRVLRAGDTAAEATRMLHQVAGGLSDRGLHRQDAAEIDVIWSGQPRAVTSPAVTSPAGTRRPRWRRGGR